MFSRPQAHTIRICLSVNAQFLHLQSCDNVIFTTIIILICIKRYFSLDSYTMAKVKRNMVYETTFTINSFNRPFCTMRFNGVVCLQLPECFASFIMVIIIYRGYRVIGKHFSSCSHVLNTMVH